MGTPTYQPIAEITLGSATATVTFSNITQAYRDLVLVLSVRSSRASANESLQMSVNSDTNAANYFGVRMFGSGSSAGSDTQGVLNNGWDVGFPPAASTSSSIFGMSVINLLDYSATDKHKSGLVRWNSEGTSGAYTLAQAMRWANNAAISSFVFNFPNGSNFTVGSTFALYGILA